MIRRALVGLLIAAGVILAVLVLLGFGWDDITRLFAHPVRGGIAAEDNPQPVRPALEPGPARPAFGTANAIVVAAYLALMLAVGLVTGRRIKSTRSFFVADGRLNYVLVGISILGTYLSALTMMGLPGAAYGEHNWTFMVQLPVLVVTAVVITSFVLPRYRAMGTVSIYAFLEERIGTPVRTIAAASFIVFAIGRMGLVLYLPALAFSTVTGVSLAVCIVGMGIIITLYTMMGGIEAVIWTDAIQVIVFIVGAAISLGFIFADLGVDQFLATAAEYNKLRLVKPSLDLTRITTLWLILETLFQTIRIYGTQQDVAQRYFTTPSTAQANRSVWIAILAYIPLGFVFYFIGTALFAFYVAHPDPALPAKADSVFPHFVVSELPAGIAGLVMAAIFAAAMSSIDSAMNSATTVYMEDFQRRFKRAPQAEAAALRMARRLTVNWGVLAVLLGLLFMRVEYVQIAWGKLMGIATNGILGLMALAFLPIRIRVSSAVSGFVVSYACLFAMMAAGINFLLWPVFGNSICFLVALLLNGRSAGRQMD